MKRMTRILALIAGAAALTGCSAHQRSSSTMIATDHGMIYLAQFSPVLPAERDGRPLFALGAGDALGQALFLTYVASVGSPIPDHEALATAHFHQPGN
jgi:hypothetical protein